MKSLSKVRSFFDVNSREQRANFDAFRLHYFCAILYVVLSLSGHFPVAGEVDATLSKNYCGAVQR